MTDILLFVLIGIAGVLLVLQIILLIKGNGKKSDEAQLLRFQMEIKDELVTSQKQISEALSDTLNNFSERQASNGLQVAKAQDMRLQTLQTSITDQMKAINTRFQELSVQTEQKLENIRNTMEKRIQSLQEENTKSLDQMRQTVDEKLQKTLDDKLKQSFSLVSERLEQVYKGLGEMQTLATGVGDLKKVLSNVKTRGILGEIQLGAILEQILSPEQYEENISTKKGSADRVEFAVKLPGDGENAVYLPIDAKFPADAYTNVIDAYETGDASQVAAAIKALEVRIKGCAKDIRDKYIDVPNTTDFAIMFLPTEGLYAEVVRHGLIEILQRDYKINIAGPTTMAALLNSLQMGFKTLAIQKRSSEVWQVLGGVKTEFDTFAKVLEQAQNRIKQADKDLENLIGVRTRQMQRKLKDIQSLPSSGFEEPQLAVPFTDDEEI